MNAAIQISTFTKFGSPDVLQIKSVGKPVPGDGEMLVRNYASTVSAADCALRSGQPFSARLFNGVTTPRIQVLGGGIAGVVESVGAGVTAFKVGDRVFGTTDANLGGHAQYKLVSQEGFISRIPEAMRFSDAVALTDGMTPLYFLQKLAAIRPGQQILVNGASGGIGVFAVQLARHFGAVVTGVCSGRNMELVRSLGAADVINYEAVDFASGGLRYDIVFDTVAKSSFGRSKRVLKPGGLYLTTAMNNGILWHQLVTRFLGSRRAMVGFAGLNQTQKQLEELLSYAREGAIRPVIDRHYAFADVAEAHRYVETGRKRGAVVVTIP